MCLSVCVCASPSLAFFRNPAPRRFHCGHPSCKPADIRNTYLRRSPFIGCPSNHHSQVVKFRHRHCGFSKNSDSCDLSFWSLSDIWFCCGLLGWYVELLHSTSRLGSLKCFQSCLWANYWWKIHMVWYGDIYDDLVNMFMYFLGDKRVCNLRWHLRKHGCGSWIYCSFSVESTKSSGSPATELKESHLQTSPLVDQMLPDPNPQALPEIETMRRRRCNGTNFRHIKLTKSTKWRTKLHHPVA